MQNSLNLLKLKLIKFFVDNEEYYPIMGVEAPNLGDFQENILRIIAKRTLREFWGKYPDSQGQLEAWHSEVLNANWENPQELKQQYGSASILKDGRAVFNICGNTYRIVVWINYKFKLVLVKYIGTHEQYDNIDANTV